MKARIIPAAALAVLAGLAGMQTAQAIPYGEFSLANHPSGTEAPPTYGLRLDGLLGPGVFTFDFNDSRSDMMLTYDDSGLRIHGETWGGQDSGGGYANGQLFAIDFMYSIGIVESRNGGMDDTMIAANHQNGGTIVALDDNRQPASSWFLRDHMGNHPASLQIGDEGGAGHRGWLGVSGWGWIDWSSDGSTWSGSESGCCSDWLFTVAVPEPSTLTLAGLGLLLLYGTRRTRERKLALAVTK